MKPWSRVVIVLSCLLAGAQSALAEPPDWAQRPVRLIVPSAAGGSGDTLARPLAEALGQQIGQTVVVENKGGVGGVLGASLVASSSPSEHQLLFGAVHHTIAPAVLKNFPYDTRKDLKAVTLIAAMPNVLVVNADSPYKSVDDLLAAARQEKGVNYGTSGVGTMLHLMAGKLHKLSGTNMTPVHYKGSNPSVMALISGDQIDFMFETMPSAVAQIRNGRLRALAVSSPERAKALPDVPTLKELGLDELSAQTWYGIFMQGDTPDETVNSVADAIHKALQTDKIKTIWDSNGALVQSNSPAEFTAYVDQELNRWSGTVQALGLSNF
ncbi:Bug family tripartite tricarboxylate transporter substrate binding protein [Alcaligenes sp. SDU_A2]|uniref:Bug family tripartite tricarboxylate transporter substrate binding protein n=1 Tax=Alcaligenes sp. SDU_A2 TaxID=3136634 RepID=UPI00311F9B61